MNESPVSQRAQLALSNLGAIVMRNNVGAAQDVTGRVIRYGLMNESEQVNRQFKSSDIVAVVPLVVQPHHVGRVIGVFGAFETKRSDWHMTPSDKRAQAQLRFMELVRRHGGIADFVTDGAQIAGIVDRYR